MSRRSVYILLVLMKFGFRYTLSYAISANYDLQMVYHCVVFQCSRWRCCCIICMSRI